jgi:biopolymer transport protein ExbD
MKLRKSRAFRRGRIEIIPMIDVMFFLLATFMLASLTLQNLHSMPVDLPQGRAQQLEAPKRITLTVSKDAQLFLDEAPVALDDLATALGPLLRGPGTSPSIVIAADNQAPNGVVVQAMLRARAAGAEHFLFAIRRE